MNRIGLSQRLELRQSQALVMTPQLQQAIKMLQLSNIELAEFIDAEIEQNPLLEHGERDSDDAPASEGDPVLAAPNGTPTSLSDALPAGMEGEVVSMHDIFVFHQTGVDENGVAQGYFAATGNRPHSLDRLAAAGFKLNPEMFERRILKPQS